MKSQSLKYAVSLLLVSGIALLSACSANKQAMTKSNERVSQENMVGAVSGANAAAYAVSQHVAYTKDADGFAMNPLLAPANQTYYFSFAKSDLRPDDMKALAVQADYLAAHPNAVVRLEGNTDNRGSREYNVGLGWRRDQTVARILEQEGVRPEQIQMVSYGKQNPANDADNSTAWAMNRRVAMLYK